MRKYLFVIVIILINAAMISCSRQTESKTEGHVSNTPAPIGVIEEDSIGKFSDERNLNIVVAKPQGRVYIDNPTIVITFARDMIPLSEQVKSDTSSIIEISPSIKGIYHWKGTRTVEFTPTGKMDLNTTYTITVRQGTASFDKTYVLKNDYTFSFVNKGFRYIGMYVDSNTANKVISSAFPSKHTVYVKFNYPVKESSLSGQINVTDKDNKTVQIKTYVMPNTPDIVAIEFPKRLKRTQLHHILIGKGIRSDYGDCGMEDDISINVVTDSKFKLKSFPKELVHPNEYIFVQFTNPLNRNNYAFHIIDEHGDTVVNKYIYKYYSGENYYNISVNLKPATVYTVIFPKAYTDYNGNEMTEDFRFTFKTDDYDPRLSLPGYNILLENYLSRRIPLNAVNYDSVYVDIEDMREAGTGKIVFSGNIGCNSARNIYETVPMAFGTFVNNKPGLYIMRYREDWMSEAYYVCMSNAAMMTKLSPSGLTVLVYDLKTGKPVKDADISFKTYTGKTDRNGLCKLPYECSLFDIAEGFGYKYPVYYSKGNDRGGIVLAGYGNWRHYNAFYPPHFLHYDSEPYYRTMLFSYNDRGLYKPGETAYIKIMHRYLTGNGLETGHYDDAFVTVYNSRGEEIVKKTLKLNEYGNAVLKIDLPDNAPTGQYYARISVSKWAIRYNYFRVEEFKPLEFTVNMSSAKQHMHGNDSTVVSVNARYMYGAPMNGDTVFWTVTAAPQSFRPTGFSDYAFTSGSHFYTRQLLSGWGIIDENGYYSIREMPDMKGITSTAGISYKARVKSMSGQEITQSCNIIYHPVSVYLGINASRYFYTTDEKPLISLVGSDLNGNQSDIHNIKLTLVKTSYYSVQKSGTGGRLYWEYETVNDTVARKQVNTKNGEYIYTGNQDMASGYYTMYAEFEEDEHVYRTSCGFYKAGSGKAYWRMSNDNYIELIPDRKGDYVAGDTAKILIKSPLTDCRAVISLERDDIISTYSIDIKSTVEVLKIPIEDEYFPNVFVSAFVYKGREKAFTDKDSIDLGKPKYGVGYCTLNVNSESKKLFVSLDTEAQQYEPQDSVHIDINVKNNEGRGEQSELSIAVVDLGVLNLIGYTTPDPLAYFYRNRANTVSMFTNAGDVIGERNYGEKGETRGGGGADERFRSEFLSLVHYSGTLETDKNGKASIAIKLPDNLTTFRIIAVAGNDKKFGSSDHDITVSKTLMMTPNLPAFVRPGDSFEAGFIAVNNAEQPINIHIDAGTENINISDIENDMMLPGMDRKPVYFTFKTDENMIDSCSFRFSIAGGSYKDKLLVTIPFRNPPVTHVNALCGTSDSVEVHYIRKPAHYIENSMKLNIGLSSTGMNDLREATAYLFHYPYGCLEQRTSCILPYVLLKREIINNFNLTKRSNSNINSIVNNYLANLSNYQKSDGGFGIWPDSKYSNPYLSCYVCLVMHYAQEAGFRLNSRVTEKALAYMEDLINGKAGQTFYWNHYSDNTKRTIKIMAMAVMTQFGKSADNYITLYRQYIETMNTEQLMYYTIAIKKGKYEKERERINKRLQAMLSVESRIAYFGETEGDPWIYFDSVKNTAAGLMASLSINGKDTPYAYQIITWMLRERKENKWRTTQSNAYALMAISEYFSIFESKEPNFTASLLIDGIRSTERTFKGYDSNSYNYTIDEAAIKNEEAKIEFRKNGEGLLYYQMMLSFIPTGKVNAEDYGFSVSKDIIPFSETVKGIVKGEKYWIVIKVKTPKDRLYVAVDDPLPAGFEIINTAFKTNDNVSTGNTYNWYYGFNHKEIYYDRFLLFADYLPKGEHEYRYLVKANFTGEFHMPQTKASEMYTPEVFGTTSGDIIKIR